jgi:hypothetical protein
MGQNLNMPATPIPHLIIFKALTVQGEFIYEELAARVKMVAKEAVKIEANIFLLPDYEKLNAIQESISGLLMDGMRLEYFVFRVCPPVVGSFLAEKEKSFGLLGLEPNNMRWLKS